MRTAPATEPPNPWKLRAILWPFATAAVAINLFLLGLIGVSMGLPAMAPTTALWLSLPFGLPATWIAARWVAGLIAEGNRD
ncbi:MAG: hypothetical protein R3D63_10380 [Paracoccaceae bacterium]